MCCEHYRHHVESASLIPADILEPEELRTSSLMIRQKLIPSVSVWPGAMKVVYAGFNRFLRLVI